MQTKRKRGRLGWPGWQVEFLVRFANEMEIADIAAEIGRTKNAVYAKAAAVGIKILPRKRLPRRRDPRVIPVLGPFDLPIEILQRKRVERMMQLAERVGRWEKNPVQSATVGTASREVA